MTVPQVRHTVQEAGEDTMKFFGLTKQQATYIAPIAVTIQGRLTTKYFKGIRYKQKNWSITPLLEYNLKREEYRLEFGFFYGF